MRRFPVPSLPAEPGLLELPAEVAHHASRVLRLRPGELITLFDGQGQQVEATLQPDGRALTLSPPTRSALPRPVHLLIGVLKGPMMDDAVRMATEAGMTHLHPILLARSVADGDRRDRWSRVAEGAARQCGRADTPTLHPPARLAEAIGRLDGVADRRIALPGGDPLPGAQGAVALLVGAEGGFTAAEIDLALGAGFAAFTLGPFILRAATAAPVACACAVAAP